MGNGSRQTQLPAALTIGIAVVVTVVWAASFIADIFIKDYDVNPLVHFLMMVVAGAAFGHGFLKNGKEKGGTNGA